MKSGLELNERLNRLAEAGMSVTKKWSDVWTESIQYFFGSQLAGRQKVVGWDWVIVNYILPAAIQEIAKLAKNNPKIMAFPWEASDSEFAESWQSVLQWLWEKGINKKGMRLEQIAQNLDKKLYGYSVSKIFWDDRVQWDAQQKTWVGDVKYRLWKPENFWALGEEKIDDGPCGTVRFVEMDWAISQWPHLTKQIKEKASPYKEFFGSGGNTIDGQTLSAGTYPAAGVGGIDRGIGSRIFQKMMDLILSHRQTQPYDDETKYIKLSEFYFRDYYEKEVTEYLSPQELLLAGMIIQGNGIYYDAKTGQPVEQWPQVEKKKYKEPRYPNGRYVLRLAEDIIVNDDEKEQAYQYSKWPFIVSPHYLLPHMWQGWDAVQMYKSAQDMINISVSHLVNNMKMFGDPKVAVERGAIDSPPGKRASHFKIGKGAGSIIRLVKGGLGRFKIIDPPAPSAAALALYGLFAQEFKNIVGLQDIATGKRTEGRITATESHFLMISANDRLSLQSVYEDVWVTECAKLIAEICQEKYDVSRIVRIIGEDNIVGAQQISQRMKDIHFDIDIVPGSQLPFDQEKKEAKYLQAYELLRDPTPNPLLPEVLRIMEIANWRKILNQHSVWQKFVQFLGLFQAVTEKKITLEQGLAILVQAAKAHFEEQQNTVESIAARNEEKERLDRKEEGLIKEGEAEGRKKERAIQTEREKARKEKENKKESGNA